MAELELRAAGPDDRATYFALFSEVQALHAAARPDLFRPPADDAAFRRLFDEAVADQDSGIELAFRDGRAVGAIHWQIVPIDESGVYLIDRPILWIESIAVAARARRSGVGRALVDKAAAMARTGGVDKAMLNVWGFNEEAREAFLRLGFVASVDGMTLDL